MQNVESKKNGNSMQFSKSRKGGGGLSEKVAPSSAFSSSNASKSGISADASWLANYGSNGGVALAPENGIPHDAAKSGGHAYYLNDGNYEKSKGLGWFVAGLFIVADLAGGGIVALPTAMVRLGFFMGFFGTILMTAIVCYSGYVLGQNWLILQRRWPHLYASGHCRKPYPEIGLRAMGIGAMNGVSACLNITQFGVAVVYLLLASKNIHDSLHAFFGLNLSFCAIVFVVAFALLPITFLKSPQDFWGFVVMGAVTSTLAVILILLASAYDYPTCAPHVHEPAFSFTNYFLALGTFIFSYGGHAVFPTIQHDMKKPHEFTKSAILAFSIVAAMYTPVSVLGYLTYGDSLRDSIINSLQSMWIQQAVNVSITVHCILTLTIVFNPINQEIEEFFRISHDFGPKRILVRTGTMCAVVFVAETLPSFGPLLDLVGGSTQTMISIIFPALFYLVLRAGEAKELEAKATKKNGAFGKFAAITPTKKDSPLDVRVTLFDIVERTDKISLFCCTFVIVFGVIGGSAATFSAIRALSTARFVWPCYVAPFLSTAAVTLGGEGGATNATGQTICCGHYQNISRFAQSQAQINGFCARADFSTFGEPALLPGDTY